MRIVPISFRLHNIRQISDLYFEYRPGCTGIFGSNGAGKSNAFHKGQYFAITGKTVGEKDNNIKQGCSSGWSEFTFSSGGLVYTRRNKLPGSSSRLSWTDADGKFQEVTGMRNVDELMQGFLGTSYDVLLEVCFARQEDLYKPVVSTKQELLKFFQRVSGCQRAESVRTAIQQKLSALPSPVDNTEKIAEGERLLAAGRGDMERLRGHMERLREKLGDDPEKARAVHREVLARALDTDVDETRRRIAGESGALDTRLRELEGRLADVPKPAPVPGGWDAAAAALSRKEDAVLRLGELRTRVLKLMEEHGRLPAPLPDLSASAAEKDRELKDLRERRDLLAGGVCPTCRRPFSEEDSCPGDGDLDGRVERAAKELEALREEWRRANEHNAGLAAEKASLESSLRAEAMRRGELEGIVSESDALLAETPGFDAVRHRELLDNNRRASEAAGEQNALAGDMAAIRTEQAVLKQRLKDLDGVAVAGAGERESARKALEDINDVDRELRSAESDMARLEGWEEGAVKALEAARREHASGERLRRVRATLEDVRALLHRDVLPRFVMSRLVEGMNSWTNFYLRRFGKNFRLKLTGDFELLRVDRDGTETPCQDWLSGGELIASALSFRMALGALMVGSLPMQLLDEPTTWLDDGTRAQLAEVLRSLHSVMDSGMHMLVPTHDNTIITALDHAFCMDTGNYAEVLGNGG